MYGLSWVKSLDGRLCLGRKYFRVVFYKVFVVGVGVVVGGILIRVDSLVLGVNRL